MTYGDKLFRVTASIGAIALRQTDATASDLLVNADLAMHAAEEHPGATASSSTPRRRPVRRARWSS